MHRSATSRWVSSLQPDWAWAKVLRSRVRYSLMRQRKRLDWVLQPDMRREGERREWIKDDFGRMGSSPADSHFINQHLLERVVMMMMMVMSSWIPTPELFSFLLTLSCFFYSFSSCSFSCRRPPSLLFPYGGHRSPRRETTTSTTGEKEKMRVKDDCMSNLRHGDCDYITFALLVVVLLLLLLLLLLRSFFSQPSSNPIRRTRLFLLCAHVYISERACACVWA